MIKAITIKSLETKTHPETKKLFWFVFAGTRGGLNRIRIISHIRKTPSNTHQLSNDIGLEYKAVQHHLKNLERNNLVTKAGNKYGATYFPSVLFEDGEAVFDEIVSKLKKRMKNIRKKDLEIND